MRNAITARALAVVLGWLAAGGATAQDAVVVAPNGYVGIGTANPTGHLHIFGGATSDVFAGMGSDLAVGPAFNYGYSGTSFGRSSGFFNIRPDASAVAPNPSLRFATGNVQRMIIDNEGYLGLGSAGFNPSHPIHHAATSAHLDNTGTWQMGSSRRLKRNILDLGAEEALATALALRPVKYEHILSPGELILGFIAEEVPNLVASPGRETLSPMDVVAVLTKVVQEQERRIEELAAQVAALAPREAPAAEACAKQAPPLPRER